MMNLLEQLAAINRTIEAELVLDLTDEDFADGQPEVTHVYLHEACHAAIAHCVPWLQTLAEDEHTAVDELMARLLENRIGEKVGLPVHTLEEHWDELQNYPAAITRDGWLHLAGVWESFFWPSRDLAGMASYALTVYRYRSVIYHILPERDWLAALAAGSYAPASLETEGFIHCSTVAQVARTANLFFKGQEGLLLLCIASDRVRAEIRYEDLAREGMLFPHLYGALNLEAVMEVLPLVRSNDGVFIFP